MYQEIVKVDKPEVLLITPLKQKDFISYLTDTSIRQNEVPFDWISYESKNNPVVNCEYAIEEYKKRNMIPKYLMKLDNDIHADDGWIDSMYNAIESSNDLLTAYAYTSFEYYGCINRKFKAAPFNPSILKNNNYISFNSLIKTDAFLDIDGFVNLHGQDRLWDWSLWLKFLKHGYIGIPVYDKKFKAYASKDSISCRSADNYYKNYKLIKNSYLFQ